MDKASSLRCNLKKIADWSTQWAEWTVRYYVFTGWSSGRTITKLKEVITWWKWSARQHHFIFIHLKYENTETKQSWVTVINSNHYIIIYNSELGQLKEASLDSFPLSCLWTLPKPGIHFNIQSIHRCVRPRRGQKCATNTFARSIFWKKKMLQSRYLTLFFLSFLLFFLKRPALKSFSHHGENQQMWKQWKR